MALALEMFSYRFGCSLVAVLHHSVPVFREPLLPCLACLPHILFLIRTGRSSPLTGDHVKQVRALTCQPPLEREILSCAADHDGLLYLARPKASEIYIYLILNTIF